MTAPPLARALGLVGWIAAALLALAAAGTRAAADDYRPVEPDDPEAGPPLRVRTLVTDGASGAWAPSLGYVLVEVENRDSIEHAVGLVVRSIGDPGRAAPFRATRTLACPPGETRRTTLPLASASFASGYEVLDVTVEGRDWGSHSIERRHGLGGGARTFVALAVGFDAENALVLERAIDDTTRLHFGHGGAGSEVLNREPRELPDRWSDLTTFPLVIVDGASGELAAERQQVLADYLGGGGRVLVLRADRLAPGPLARAITEPDPFGPPPFAEAGGTVGGSCGFGAWLTSAGGPEAVRGLDRSSWFLVGAFEPWAGRFPEPLAVAWPIPEIGRVPVRLFVGLILVYVVVAGPGSFLWFRKRRPGGWLVTAPLLGLGLTAGILGWGLLGEGVSVRSTVASVTLLDQRRHEAHTVATRTLYAGISPRGGLRPGAGTGLVPLAQRPPDDEHGYYGPGRDRASRVAGSYEVDLDDGGRLSSGAVPSRTLSSFLTVSRSRVRARLAFRRLREGGLELLADPELQPVAEPGSLVVRDFAGKLLILEAGGKLAELEPTPESLARMGRLLRVLPQAYAGARGQDAGGDPGRDPRGRDEPLAAALGDDAAFVLWLGRRLRGEGLAAAIPPGTYIARVRRSPAVDALGLEADERLGCHIVIGALAEEDIVEPR